MRAAGHLGRSLLGLRPVQHALRDPHYALARRPIDSAWHHADFTGVMSGFNPSLHTHFYAAHSSLDRWLADPEAPMTAPGDEDHLVKEVLHLAHDYLHSWAYRALGQLDPALDVHAPVTRENLEQQAFLFILTEAVAVVGLDYWYLCVKDVDERCHVRSGVGPRTVHYRERLLAEYRRFNPELVVQHPDFLLRILKLYCVGELAGFVPQDLLASPTLAQWLIREFLISPRQRFVTRLWLSRLGGLAVDAEALSAPLPRPSAAQWHLAAELGAQLWRKIKHGAQMFFPPSPVTSSWRHASTSNADYRCFNLSRVAGPTVDWDAPDRCSESFAYYVDQYLSRYRLPDCAATGDRDALRRKIDAIKQNFDHHGLAGLAAGLTPVRAADHDPAPLELLFVN